MCWSVIHGPSIELDNYRSWISCKEQSSTINTLVNHVSHWLENMVISQWHFLEIIVSFFLFFCTDSFLVFFLFMVFLCCLFLSLLFMIILGLIFVQLNALSADRENANVLFGKFYDSFFRVWWQDISHFYSLLWCWCLFRLAFITDFQFNCHFWL